MDDRVFEDWRSEYRGYVFLRYRDHELVTHAQSGFFNATQLCQRNGRLYEAYAGLKRCADLDAVLQSKFGVCSWDAPNVARTSPVAGTYVHPLKLLDVACWLSYELYVKCAMTAQAFFTRTPHRRAQLKETLTGGDTCVELAGERIRVGGIGEAGAEFLAADGGQANAGKMCKSNRQDADGMLERVEGARQVFEALRRNWDERPGRPVEPTVTTYAAYVHPIVAIRVLLWHSPEEYARLAGVIFARWCPAPAEEDRPSGSRKQFSRDANVPSDRNGRRAQPTRTVDEDDDEDTLPGAGPEVERLNREHATVRKESQIRPPKGQMRAKDPQMDELLERFEHFWSDDERARRAASVRDIIKRHGAQAVECVLAVRLASAPNAVYAFRCQLQSLVPALAAKLETDAVDHYDLWYATNTAVQDFKDCKYAARRLAGSYPDMRVMTSGNTIRATSKGASVTDEAELAGRVRGEVERVLRAAGLLQLDVSVVRALFGDNRPDAVRAIEKKPTGEIEGAVYRWLREAYEKRNVRPSESRTS